MSPSSSSSSSPSFILSQREEVDLQGWINIVAGSAYENITGVNQSNPTGLSDVFKKQ